MESPACRAAGVPVSQGNALLASQVDLTLPPVCPFATLP